MGYSYTQVLSADNKSDTYYFNSSILNIFICNDKQC